MKTRAKNSHKTLSRADSVLSVRAFALLAFFLFVPAIILARDIPPKEGWRHWQSLYNRNMAAKETDPAKREEWLNKPLVIKELSVGGKNPLYPDAPIFKLRGASKERCVTCHDGIAETAPAHPLNFGCVVCHGGDPLSVLKAEAHKRLISGPGDLRNPSDLRVADKSCGLKSCHAGHDQNDLNHIRRVKKSIMATNAGEISALRYLWGGQPGKYALYGSFGITDEDGYIPLHRGGLTHLDTIPFFSKTEKANRAVPVSGRIADSRWRKSCDSCHLWGRGKAREGAYRSSGCAACHVPYDKSGLYMGNDPTIHRDEPGHMISHTITSRVRDRQCLSCHFEFKPKGKFKGVRPKPDAHTQKGMSCIDCHTQFDVMGDTNIYSKGFEQIEIRCETCHGDTDSAPFAVKITDPNDRALRLAGLNPHLENNIGDTLVVSARGNKLINVKVEDEAVVLYGKLDGKRRTVPLIKEKSAVHSFPGHLGKLECVACHGVWSVDIDYGNGHYDQRRSSKDKLFIGSPATRGGWTPSRPTARAIKPNLIMGPRGKAALALLRRGFFLTALDYTGKPFVAMDEAGNRLGYYKDWSFTEPGGYPTGSVLEAKTVHSVGRKVRPCASCHLDPSALSLGRGDIRIGSDPSGKKDKVSRYPNMLKSGSPLNFPGGVKGTIRGEQVGGGHQLGVRAFTGEEVNRILGVGVCVSCHDKYQDPIYMDIEKSYSMFDTMEHKEKVKGMLEGL